MIYKNHVKKTKKWIELMIGIFILITFLLALFLNDFLNAINFSKTNRPTTTNFNAIRHKI